MRLFANSTEIDDDEDDDEKKDETQEVLDAKRLKRRAKKRKAVQKRLEKKRLQASDITPGLSQTKEKSESGIRSENKVKQKVTKQLKQDAPPDKPENGVTRI